MRAVRLVLRTLGCFFASIVLALVCIVGLPVAMLLGRSPRWRSVMTRVWARTLGWIVGMRVERVGPVPEGPVLLVANHLSYVDIFLLGGSFPCAFISKAEVARWPGIGQLATLAGTLFLDRTRRKDVRRIAAEMQSVLDSGRAVVFFPEGTSTSGDDVAPFRSSLLEPPAAAAIPVHYASLSYETPPGEVPARLSVAWWGDMDLAPHLTHLLQMPGFRARIVFGEAPITGTDRKELTLALEEAVRAGFTPMGSPAIEDASAGRSASAATSPSSAAGS